LETENLSEQSKTILRNNYQMMYAMYLFGYERMDYASSNQLPLEFYDFLQDIPMDNKELLSTERFYAFINCLEYCQPLSANEIMDKRLTPEKNYGQYLPLSSGEMQLETWKIEDSLYTNVLKLKPGIVYDVVKIRSLDFTFRQQLKDDKEEAWKVLTALTSDIPESFLRKEADRLFLKYFPEEQRAAYELPDTYEAKIFKDLIAPFKGKALLVDFWSTTCGPCVYNIKQDKTLREKYIDSPDVDFVFITAENESPLNEYEKFVAEQELTHTFRLNADQYRYLRQLFRFNGIPHYVLVDREGKIMNDNLQRDSQEEEIKIFTIF